MKTDFLIAEFQECFAQMRYYDTVQTKMFNLSLLLASIFVTALWAIAQVDRTYFVQNLGLVIQFSSLFLLIFNVISLTIVLRNRVYFVFCTRQMNTIRWFLIRKEVPSFLPKNQMYLSENFSMYKPFNVHSLIAYIFVLFIAGCVWLIVSFSPQHTTLLDRNLWTVWTTIFSFLLGIFFIPLFFSWHDKQSSDKVIHNK